MGRSNDDVDRGVDVGERVGGGGGKGCYCKVLVKRRAKPQKRNPKRREVHQGAHC